MKKNYPKTVSGIIFAAALALLLSAAGSACADTWQDIYRKFSSGKVITPGVQQVEKAYGATVTFTVTDGDSFANNFSNSDGINLRIEGNGVTKTFAGNKTQLIDWARQNANDLLKAFFGGSPETNFAGSSNTQFNSQMVVSSILSTSEKSGTVFIPVNSKDITVKGQYDFMKINDVSARGSSDILSYEYGFGSDKSNAIGISIPYRQLSMDDSANSEYKFIAFTPYYKHRWSLDRSMVEWIVNIVGDVTYVKSDMFPTGGGYLEYGGGTGVKYTYAVNEDLHLNAGLTYQALKKSIPGGLVPDDVKWVSDAINALPVEHDITPSLGLYYFIIKDTLSFRADVMRIHQLQSDVESGYKAQTVALGVFTYDFPKYARASLGYKRSFEMKNITDQSIIASLGFKW
jgi:hypothetical protein